jgi:hypothetical protein
MSFFFLQITAFPEVTVLLIVYKTLAVLLIVYKTQAVLLIVKSGKGMVALGGKKTIMLKGKRSTAI